MLINVTDNITLSSELLVLLATIIAGVVFAVIYNIMNNKEGINFSFTITLIVIPILVASMVMLVSNDIVRAFSLGGLFVLVRFRTRIKDIKDATLLFTVIVIGFACGLEYFIFAGIVGLVIATILLICHAVKLDKPNPKTYRLKIMIPESLDYVNVFDLVFEKYLDKSVLKKVKLTDFGSLIELTYLIKFKDLNNQKEFLDALRKKNGNLNIVIASDWEKIVNITE